MNKEYINTCTHTQKFDKTKSICDEGWEETIPVKTIVTHVRSNTEVGFVDSWFDNAPHGYTFKIKGGDGRDLWVYYNWFLVPNTPKNVEIIDTIQELRAEIAVNEHRICKLRNSYEK
jgi:hypothetical protein